MSIRFRGMLPAILCLCCLAAAFSGCSRTEEGANTATIRIGTKNFTEQLILGELMAQLIEAHTDLKVERRFNLGGTMICHQALTNGEIDLYPEYTGTALTAILNRQSKRSPTEILSEVQEVYEDRFQAVWLAPFGFNNTYAITVRGDMAAEQGWDKADDLRRQAPELTAGFTAEFHERPDGYPGFKEAYGFEFGRVVDLDPGLMYRAIREAEVDVICAFATDGRIAAYNLQILNDNRGFFPPYQAAPVVRRQVLDEHPELRRVLGRLAGALDDKTMRGLNYEVDENQRDPAEVAREFLARL